MIIVLLSLIAGGCQKAPDEFEVLRSHADEVLQAMTPTKTVTDVKMIIDDPAEAAKYTIVSVRAAADYAKGHVPGAINIPWKDIAKAENLKKQIGRASCRERVYLRV